MAIKTIQAAAILIFILIINTGFSQVKNQDTAYFQQNVNYKIDVELDDANQTLHGFIEIEYQNNSTNSIDTIPFHIWPNSYKNENTSMSEQMLLNGDDNFYWTEERKLGYIDSLDFKNGDGTQISWELDKNNIDICYLYLSKPILPREKIIITTPFRVKLPSTEFSRLGVSENQKPNYMISQWYPKPAVFDKKGWHAMPYLNQGEFYSEFGSFEVNIKVPKTIIIAASGEMSEKKNVILNFGKEAGKEGFSFHYKIDKVHDFAWFASSQYKMNSKVIKLESGKEVTLQAYYLIKNTENWSQALTYMERAVLLYSEKVGEYPYSICTAVDGNLAAGGGMEYPTITVIGYTNNLYQLEATIAHEIGHNWFYGILGFNERDYPWMDEGINTYYQTVYEDKYFADISMGEYLTGNKNLNLNKFDLSINDQYYYTWLFAARKNLSQPLSYSSEEYSSLNYGISAYYKSALLFQYLESYVGENEMDSLMQGFYSKWKFKHPQPEDFISYFKNNSTKNLDWFFDDYFFTTNNIDYAITNVKKTDETYIIKVKNKGDISAPIIISSIDTASKIIESKEIQGIRKSEKIVFNRKDVNKIIIDSKKQMPDYNRNNNIALVNKIFPTLTPKKIKFGYSKPYNGKDPLFILPSLGWNKYNGFMAGIMVYNDPIFERKWEYQLLPLYSFASKNINGEIAIYRNFYAKGFIRKMSIGVSAKKYDYNFITTKIGNSSHNDKLLFYRIVPKIDFFLKTPSNNSRIQKRISIRYFNIGKEILDYTNVINSSSTVPYANIDKLSLFELTYSHFHNKIINPYGFEAKFQMNDEIIKGQLTVNKRFNYTKKKALDIRLFLGNIFSFTASNTDYSFKMSGWDGGDDYLYDFTFPGRSEGAGFWSAHMQNTDGGFGIPTPLGRSWSWIAAVNLTSHIPVTNFIRVYANAGFYPSPIASQGAKVLYEAGVKLTFINQYFEIYLPAFWSQEITDVAILNNRADYGQKIRFIMRLDMANPIKYLREMEL